LNTSEPSVCEVDIVVTILYEKSEKGVRGPQSRKELKAKTWKSVAKHLIGNPEVLFFGDREYPFQLTTGLSTASNGKTSHAGTVQQSAFRHRQTMNTHKEVTDGHIPQSA
jgi:hypothetical protein